MSRLRPQIPKPAYGWAAGFGLLILCLAALIGPGTATASRHARHPAPSRAVGSAGKVRDCGCVRHMGSFTFQPLLISAVVQGTPVKAGTPFKSGLVTLPAPSPYLRRCWQVGKFYAPSLMGYNTNGVAKIETAEEGTPEHQPITLEIFANRQLVFSVTVDEVLKPSGKLVVVATAVAPVVISADLISPITVRNPTTWQAQISGVVSEQMSFEKLLTTYTVFLGLGMAPFPVLGSGFPNFNPIATPTFYYEERPVGGPQ